MPSACVVWNLIQPFTMNCQQRAGFIHWIMRIGSIAIRTGRDKNAALRIEMFICNMQIEWILPIPTRVSISRDLGLSVSVYQVEFGTSVTKPFKSTILHSYFADLSALPLSAQLHPFLAPRLSSPVISALPLPLPSSTPPLSSGLGNIAAFPHITQWFSLPAVHYWLLSVLASPHKHLQGQQKLINRWFYRFTL